MPGIPNIPNIPGIPNTPFGGSGAIEAITGITSAGAVRSDGAFAGFRFTPNVDMTVRSLGRWKLNGNSGTANLSILHRANGIAGSAAATELATINIEMASGPDDQFSYAQLSSPVHLTSGQTYIVASNESGGDDWLDVSVVSHQAALTSVSACYFSGGLWSDFSSGDDAFVPTGFRYDL